MRLTWATTLVALLLTSAPLIVADDIHCDKSTPCEVGCCGSNNVCGTGPDYCSKAKCINNCDFKAECNPGNWPSQYFNSTKCPLNVCCSKYGFCGTTEEFCGKETVKRPSCSIGSQSVKRVIGYYGSGGASRRCNSMIPQSFPQGIYTHIYFAFGSIDPNSFKVVPAGKADEKLYPQLAALKTRDVGQELWLSIGGWTFSDKGAPTATTFSDLVNAPEHRQQAFFISLTLFMQTWGFAGIDIDWEYPVDKDRNGRQSDFKAYPRFLKRLRSALDTYKYGLSVTLPTSYWYLQHFDLEGIEPSVDWFNVMSYDLHGAWDIGNKWTGAFVGGHTNLTEIKSSLDLLWRNKVSPSKVVLGLAFYGRAVTLADPSCSEPGCAYLSAADAGKCSGEPGILFNSEISDLIHEKKLRPKFYKDAAIKTIQWNNDQWVSYDDRDTWKLKSNFLKSQCLSGVLVWAVDYDDSKHSYSKGLAAALGVKINVDTDGLAIKMPSTKKESNDFCYFTNCGQTCPSGYTEVVRGDKDSQVMLDSTECLPGQNQVQTLCCPKSSKVPTCRWRGFHNSGHCTVGCNSGEVEVGTHHAGCKKSGWQTACCDSTESVKPWSKCGWTDVCYDDDDTTCAKGFSSFVVGSRGGFGGQRSCKKGKKYNFCCTETPKAFKNCEWVGHEVSFINSKACTNSCPHGSTRIAAQDISTSFSNSGNLAHTNNCNYGFEGYCCAGDNESDKDEKPIIQYRDYAAEQFDHLLSRFLRDPECPEEWRSQYISDFGVMRRDLSQPRGLDQSAVLSALVPITATLIGAEIARRDMIDIWQRNMRQSRFRDTAANISTLHNAVFPGGNISGGPARSPTLVAIESLCNLGESREGMENLGSLEEALCEIPSPAGPGSDKRHVLEARRLNFVNAPTIATALEGINNGQLRLHYMRWLESRNPNNPGPPTQVILEIGFWIGPNLGIRPIPAIQDRFSDPNHSQGRDRWIVVHLHIPLSELTFRIGSFDWEIGVSSFGMYHSQDTQRPNPGPSGITPHYRAEWRYTDSYAEGYYNTGAMRNYNIRMEPFNCRYVDQRNRGLWYPGHDYSRSLETLREEHRTTAMARSINRFGIWLRRQGTFSRDNLARIWPEILNREVPNDNQSNWGQDWYNPVPGVFDQNWLPSGNGADDLSGPFP
ncbi:hypothetical protein FIE12Z_4383 [Fusarium flagelliforme]|uniref:chitinase n=1 Tax=Fusarium flagelliforme TaxID=2675880 RepID=A0A395MVT6_9HYPO|nr:hypothetical protein FIE12Z_4383 [Fusarium flagelliforme]